MTPRRVAVIVTIVLVLLAAGVAVPVVYAWRAAAARTTTIEHLKRMGLAMHNCNDARRRLPPAFDSFADITYSASVHVHLLQERQQDAVYRKYLSQSQGNREETVAPYLSPMDGMAYRVPGVQNFAANLRVFSDKGVNTKYDQDMPALSVVEPGTAAIPRTFLDGTSNCIVFATKYAVCGEGGSRYAAEPISPYAAFFGQNPARTKAHPSDVAAVYQLRPSQEDCHYAPLMAQSFSTGLQVGIADGTVRTLAPDLTPSAWNYALQPNDGNVMSRDFCD